MGKINWKKVFANGGVGFFTGLSSVLTFEALVQADTSSMTIITAALIGSGVQGGLKFFNELLKESEEDT